MWTAIPETRNPYCYVQVLIQDGYLLEGTLCKKTLGASGGRCVQYNILMTELLG